MISAIGDLEPARSERWRRGQILYFSIDRLPCATTLENALLVDGQGAAWHLRILSLTRPRSSHSQAIAGVIAWLGDHRKAAPALLSIVRESPSAGPHSRIAGRRGAA